MQQRRPEQQKKKKKIKKRKRVSALRRKKEIEQSSLGYFKCFCSCGILNILTCANYLAGTLAPGIKDLLFKMLTTG